MEEAHRPEVDHDTKGLGGSPEIAAAIAVKIRAAACFVADMTPVGVTDPATLRPDLDDERRPPKKHLQNPNVMSELGYAEHALGLDKIVLVANAAHYPGAEALPFDWRHRRGPLTYNLPDTASKDDRQRELKSFAQRLIDPIRQVLDVGSSPVVAPDVGPDEADTALWSGARSGVEFLDEAYGRKRRASLPEGPRLYAKVSPAGWSPIPIARLTSTLSQKHLWLWIRGTSGTFGRNGHGAFSAQKLDEQESGDYVVGSMTQWFQKTGVVWAVDTTSFGTDEYGSYFAFQTPFAHLAEFLRRALATLREAGAQGPFKIELGCTGLSGTSWPGQFRSQRSEALKDSACVTRRRGTWQPESLNAVLLEFWNELTDAFGLEPAQTLEQFERAAAIQLNRND